MNIIGITGSSGSGKSTVCDILNRDYDVKIIDADKIAKKLSNECEEYINDITMTFGKDILDAEGNLKRSKLADVIYNNFKKRELLNSVTFKYIVKKIEEQIEKETQYENIIIDAPLLFESGLDKICKYVIGVISNKEVQIKRISLRDNIDYVVAEKRLNAQKDNEFYISKCEYIIENNNDIFYIEEVVQKLAKTCNITKKLQ